MVNTHKALNTIKTIDQLLVNKTSNWNANLRQTANQNSRAQSPQQIESIVSQYNKSWNRFVCATVFANASDEPATWNMLYFWRKPPASGL